MKSVFKKANQEFGLPTNMPFNQNLVADLNQDHFLDLILTNNFGGKFETKFFLNQGGKSFKEVAVIGFIPKQFAVLKMAKGLFHPEKWGVIVRYPNHPLEAYDLNVTSASVSFERFNVKKFPNTISSWGDIQIFDYNNDGRLDFIGTSYYLNNSKFHAGPTYLFEKLPDGSFKDTSLAVGIQSKTLLPIGSKNAYVPSYMANVCDINNDGYLDLLIAGYGRRWNQLYLYSNGKYLNMASGLNFDGDPNGKGDFRGNGNSFVSQCADLNQDGKLDVFQGEITHNWAGPTSDISSILYNNFPKPFVRFTDFPRPKKFDNQGDIGADIGDINLDGQLDLVIANSDYPPETKLTTFLMQQNGNFSNISDTFEAVTNPKGVVLFDFDRDGDLDMVLGEISMRGHKDPSLKFFKNMTQEHVTKSFVNFILEGDGKSVPRSPVGSRVRIKNAPKILMRELVFGGGQDISRPLEAHFGIPMISDSKVEVEVRWSNKKIETIKVDKNKTYKISYTENGAKVLIVK